MLNNQYHGITVEDLEKAASVRLFEKAAAAEGLNLNEFSEAQVDDLYSNYQHSSEENTMNEEIFDLFEKQAAYEGVDLDALSDDELAYVFDNFVGNLEADYEDDYEDDYDDYYVDEEEEAYEKLAEAEILGRHMARAYMDEMEKEAGALRARVKSKEEKAREAFEQVARDRKAKQLEEDYLLGKREKRYSTAGKKKAKQLAIGQSAGEKMRSTGRSMGKHFAKHKGRYAMGAGGLALAGGAYAAGRSKEKTASAEITDMAIDRANEFIEFGKEAGYDGSLIDGYALELLENEGWDISPLFY